MADGNAATGVMRLPDAEIPVSRRGNGPPLLILHDGEGPVSALPFCDPLAAQFEVIEPVHPGFAGTAIPQHFDNLQDLLYLYLDLMDELALRDVTVLGFGMGGWLAAELAAMSTTRMSRLILVGAVGIKAGGRDDRDIVDVFQTNTDELARLLWRNPALAPKPSTFSDEEAQRVAAQRIAHAMYTWDPYMHNPKLKRRLRRVRIPTLLIWGQADRMVAPGYAEAYRAAIPGADLTFIPDAGHFPHVEQPAAFVAEVTRFCAAGGRRP